MDFFGRQDLLRQLGELWLKRMSSFVTCRGRRRIGKSTLIERFAEKVRRLQVRQGISVRTALVYDGVLAKGVRGSGFFDALISAAELLGRAG